MPDAGAGAPVAAPAGAGAASERMSLTLGAVPKAASGAAKIDGAGPACFESKARPRLVAKNAMPKTTVAWLNGLARVLGCIMLVRLEEAANPPPAELPSVFCRRMRPIMASAISR